MAVKTENRGGKRPGSGPKRKKKTVSEKVKRNYERAARKLAKEFGMPIEEAMLRMIFDKDVQDTVKASIMKTYNEALLVKETEKTVTKREEKGPVIGLPPVTREDPANLVPIDGGINDTKKAKDGN